MSIKAPTKNHSLDSSANSDSSYERGPYWELRKRRTSSSLSAGDSATESSATSDNPTAVEVHEWVQSTHCHQHDNTLRPGHLLRWMDITACLSAEKHAKVPCVTVSVDDIIFDTVVSVDNVVIIRAVVNRAFTSSMEVGITVDSEDPLTGDRKSVCKAYSVFVARPYDGSKVTLPPVPIATHEENKEYLLAAERRRMRISYSKDREKIIKGLRIDERNPVHTEPSKVEVPMSKTQVHTIKIVLPVHANHHGTTFGGQIMEWVTEVATISALRLCRSRLVLEGIESFHFRGPSKMGERISLQSSVNKVFTTKKFEVGVRVDGFAVGGERRHINSAFFIFRPSDESVILPKLIPDSKVEEVRAANAVARHCLWLDRKTIQFRAHEVTVNSENVFDLILKNTAKLMTNYSLQGWETIQQTPVFNMSKLQNSENFMLRIKDTLVGVSAKDAFLKVTNYRKRNKWDFLVKNTREFRKLTEDDTLLHMSYNSTRSGELPKDFVLLASKRQIQDRARGPDMYVAAFSSVKCDELPPLDDYCRSSVISSGYILQDTASDVTGKSCCKLTYVHQLGSSVMPFFAQDLLGASTLIEKLAKHLRQYLLEPTPAK